MSTSKHFFHYPTKKPSLWNLNVVFLVLIIPVIFIVILLTSPKEIVTKPPIPTPIPTMPIPTPAPYPINTTGVFPGDEVTARGVVAIDVDSHVFLYKRNETMLLSPASTTKLLTALVALDVYKLDDVATIASVSATGQVMGLVPGEKITVENLLYGALIQSGNDAAFALAQLYPLGEQKFMDLMNEKARTLHMDQSHFVNPAGLDDLEHKVTPADLSLLALAAIQNKTIAKMVAIPQITVSDINHIYFHKLANVNQLLGKIPGVGGIKTGWTEEAGENLITYVERNNHRIILVVLHSKDRFGDTIKLIDWAFENYRWDSSGV